MSISTVVPTTPTPDRQNLEPLQELKLKGFGSHQDTPTSKTASLPTPGGASVPLANGAVVHDAPICEFPHPDLNEWDSYDPFTVAPGAPLLKDLDSFTDGTGTGSFDSIPVAETDEHGNLLPPLSEARLSMVTTQDKDAYILRWLDTLSTSQPAQAPFFTHDEPQQHRSHRHHRHNRQYHYFHRVPTLKRPRSVTEYEEYRPRRPRTRSCPSSWRGDSMEPD